MSNQLAAIQKILASNLHSDKSLRHAIAGMNKNQAQDLMAKSMPSFTGPSVILDGLRINRGSILPASAGCIGGWRIA